MVKILLRRRIGLLVLFIYQTFLHAFHPPSSIQFRTHGSQLYLFRPATNSFWSSSLLQAQQIQPTTPPTVQHKEEDGKSIATTTERITIDDHLSIIVMKQMPRRRSVVRGLLGTTMCALSSLSTPFLRSAHAVTTDEPITQEITTSLAEAVSSLDSSNNAEREQRITRMLQAVPTFTIVDASGVPYMVVGEDAKVTAYFFTSYGEAARILQLASESADQSMFSSLSSSLAEPTKNPWKEARISTVPLDTAVGLTLKSRNGSLRSYFQVAASANAIDDALSITGDDDLAETKVPLFYVPGSSELYFERSQISKSSQVQVTELFALLRTMASSEDLNDLRIVAPKESAKKAKECERKGGSAPPLVLGKRNIIL